MKQTLEYIAAATAEFGRLPLFQYLRDESIAPLTRLQFVPQLAHFIMTFADLYRDVFPENPPRDRYQELVNIHVAEESGHWKWYLSDLSQLELDPLLRFTDVLRFLWGDATRSSRTLSYTVCRLNATASSLERLAMVQVIERTAEVALMATVPAAQQVAAQAKRKLVFLGPHHLETEQQHTLQTPDVFQVLQDVTVSASDRVRLFAVIDAVFAAFTSFAEEAFAFTKQQTLFTRKSDEEK